jgi:hypothetical protein
MSDEIKMSDYFYLPVKSDGWDSISDKRGVLVKSLDFDGITNPIEHAINNHDRLESESKQLREALDLLYESFKPACQSGRLTRENDVAMRFAAQVLEGDKDDK